MKLTWFLTMKIAMKMKQYQGILAYKLGFDCSEVTENKGVTYCVYRTLVEVTI